MLTLGISGSLDLVNQSREHIFPRGTCHDAAAVLVEDGKVVAGIEEERLNRIKHSSKGPINSIRFCLESRGIKLNDIDFLTFYGSEQMCTALLRNLYYTTPEARPVTSIRPLMHEFLQAGLGEDLDDRKITFINHHLAHATSAYAQSGQRESLVFTIDGAGDGLCGSVSHWTGSAYRLLQTFPMDQSLGTFYLRVIAMLGFAFTEEYKVMGLAPYGDRAKYRAVFRSLYDLRPKGNYVLHWERMDNLYALAPPRRKGEPILEKHLHIAAGLQESLERIVLHMVRHFSALTGLRSMCIAGGVAHNSTLNGRILYSGLFDDIFVQPASHDGGCAIGAALYSQITQKGASSGNGSARLNGRIEDVYWGTDIGDNDEIAATLTCWQILIDFERVDDVAARSAQLLADGRVIGWVQGRSEFGPRALGNRSILADPRPAENKDLINRMIKKRESYRPFAPAVLEESADEYFEIPIRNMRFPFMSFTVRVRPEKRSLLGATTHVDGTARIQTVSRRNNSLFWKLIEEFGKIAGVRVLLNTSFNNNVEPIVDSVEDALVCFLTTDLHHLVVGDFVVSKKKFDKEELLNLAASLPSYSRLVQMKSADTNGAFVLSHAVTNSYNGDEHLISESLFNVLMNSDGNEKLSAVIEKHATQADVVNDIFELWQKRVITVRPICDRRWFHATL
jgi:carbamoyltransferase